MYKLLAGAVGVALLVTSVSWFSYKAGVNSEIAAGAKAIAEYQEKERQNVKELEEAKNNREVIYRDKIKIVKQAIDPTGCTDADVPDSILQQFEQGGSASFLSYR